MSNARRTLTLAAALALAIPAAAGAQTDLNLPVPTVHQVGLLLIPGVQKELKLDPAQLQEVQALARRTQEFMVKSIQEFQAKPLQERVPAVEAMNAKLATDTKSGLAAFLKPDQLARLRQVSLQQRGGMSFAEPEVQEALKMSENQRARIRSQVSELFFKLRQMAGTPGDPQAVLAKSEELRRKLADTIVGELSDEQKAEWTKLIGAPFAVEFPRLPAGPTAPAHAPKPAGPATPR